MVLFKVLKVKSIIYLSTMIICLTGCYGSSSRWDGTFESLPHIAQACAVGWVDNIHTIKSLESMLNTLSPIPSTTLILKSGNSGWAKYEFFGLFKYENELKSFYISSEYDKPLIDLVSDSDASELISLIEQSKEIYGEVIEGDYQNLSHTPCDFVFYRSMQSEFMIAHIGLRDSDNEIDILKTILDVKDNSVAKTYESKNLPFERAIPPQRHLDILETRIRNDVFFELNSFNQNGG